MAITLYGFNGSTYVRTVRMVLAEKGAHYDQVPVNVLEGEPKQPEHLARHPFGKVPVLDHDGFRIIETSAIAPYLDAVLPGPSLVPQDAKRQARMHMAMGVLDSYGYGALLGVAAYHLFPDFVGGQNEQARKQGIETGRKVLDYVMRLRGADPWLGGPEPSLADFYLAPILAYVAMTPDLAEVSVPGLDEWWQRAQALPSFQATA